MKSSATLSLASTAFTIVALALTLLIPLCSIKSDPNHLSTLQFATIDASATHLKINNDEYTGLPDPYDFSKHKQIYQIYLLNYCSGYKRAGSDEVVIDFCSKNGHELWDILTTWQMWGVSVRPDNAAKFEWLKKGPNWLYIVYLTAIIMLGLNTLGTFSMLHQWKRAKWFLFALSAATSCTLLGAAIACQVTYGILVSRADDDQVSITAQMGKSVYAVNWVAAGCSLGATILSLIYCKKGSDKDTIKFKIGHHKAKSQSTSYKYESMKGEAEMRVVSTTHSREPSMERHLSSDNLVADGRGRAQERQYDPFLAPQGKANLRAVSPSRSRSPSQSRFQEMGA